MNKNKPVGQVDLSKLSRTSEALNSPILSSVSKIFIVSGAPILPTSLPLAPPIVSPVKFKAESGGLSDVKKTLGSSGSITSASSIPGQKPIVTTSGYIGAYTPEQRKLRIERFLEKRTRRVWTRKVKYDVRKNFADSRLRIKVQQVC